MSRRYRLLITVLLTSATLVGVLSSGILLGRGATPTAYAATCVGPWAACSLGEPTRTSALTVQHVYDPTSTNQAVEPNTGEDWSITAYWNSNTFPCLDRSETATVSIDWSSVSRAGQWKTRETGPMENAIGVVTVARFSVCA